MDRREELKERILADLIVCQRCTMNPVCNIKNIECYIKDEIKRKREYLEAVEKAYK